MEYYYRRTNRRIGSLTVAARKKQRRLLAKTGQLPQTLRRPLTGKHTVILEKNC
jgi:hypothetical protein